MGYIADIAGKDDGFFHAVFPQRQSDHGRPQQMARVKKFRRHTGADLKRLSIITGFQKCQRAFCIRQGIQRLHQIPTCPAALLVFPGGVAFLDMSTVPQHDG